MSSDVFFLGGGGKVKSLSKCNVEIGVTQPRSQAPPSSKSWAGPGNEARVTCMLTPPERLFNCH